MNKTTASNAAPSARDFESTTSMLRTITGVGIGRNQENLEIAILFDEESADRPSLEAQLIQERAEVKRLRSELAELQSQVSGFCLNHVKLFNLARK